MPKKNEKNELPKVKSSVGPKIGNKINNFSLPATGGEVELSQFKGKTLVLYFYPKDATPGCTLEGQDFSRLLPKFKKANAVVYGVSRDSLKSHEKFKEKQNYGVELISDVEEVLCRYFDVIKEKNMYGKKVWGIERSTFVIGPDGKLVSEWRKVKVENHADEVLKTVQSI